LVRATGWLLNTDEVGSGQDVDTLLQRWDHKQHLLSCLIMYMDHLPFFSNQRWAGLCHQMIEMLCAVDLGFQDMVLRYLHEQFASREAMQTTRFGSHHRIAPHIDVSAIAETNYYSFVPRFVMSVLRSGDVETVRTAIDLVILVAKELLLLPSLLPSVLLLITPVLKEIWEHPQYNQVIRENHRLSLYVALVLTNVPQSLDTPPLAELITTMFPVIVGSLPPNHRETIVRTLAEKIRYQIVYINQASAYNQHDNNNNTQQSRLDTFVSLVQTLKALSIVFTDSSMKAQFIHEHQQLLTSLAEMARTLPPPEDTNNNNNIVQPEGSAGILPLSRVQELVKLVSSLTAPQT